MRAASPAFQSHTSASPLDPSSPSPAFFDIARDEVFRLETKRMWLRWPHHTDAPAITSWAGLAEVADMTATWPAGIAEDDVRERIASARAETTRGVGLRLALTQKSESSRVIGQIGVGASSPDVGRLGYHLDPTCNAQGLMTEALGRLIEAAGQVSTLTRIEAGVRLINPASRRVLEKCGFVHVGQGITTSPHRGDMPVDHFALTLPPRPKLALAA
jgi:RimJ/RimL family protein N-acetyltransferase